LPEWLPPRRVLQGQHVGAAWAELGPPIRVVAVADGGLVLSENGGRAWEPVGPKGVRGQRVLSLDYDAGRHILTVTTESGDTWVSTDGGARWLIEAREEKPLDDPAQAYAAQLPPGTLVSVAIPGAPGTPVALVAGTPNGLQISPDGGASWTQPALPNEGSVTALARDPERRDRLYAATSTGYLFESGNRGRTWESINAEPVGAVGALYVIRI
jgi:photosystem II stability/assembly factor-like uncharacterized protein